MHKLISLAQLRGLGRQYSVQLVIVLHERRREYKRCSPDEPETKHNALPGEELMSTVPRDAYMQLASHRHF